MKTIEELIKNHKDFSDTKRFSLINMIGMDADVYNFSAKLTEMSISSGNKATALGLLTVSSLACIAISPALLIPSLCLAGVSGLACGYNAIKKFAPFRYQIFVNKFTKKGRLENARIELLNEVLILEQTQELFSTSLPKCNQMTDIIQMLVDKRLCITESFNAIKKKLADLAKFAKETPECKEEVKSIMEKYINCVSFVQKYEKNYLESIQDLENAVDVKNAQATKVAIDALSQQLPLELFEKEDSKPKHNTSQSVQIKHKEEERTR